MQPAPSWPRRIRALILVILLSALILPAGPAQAQAGAQADPAAALAFVPPSSRFRASPRVIPPIGGKLPTKTTLAVLANCDLPNPPDLSKDSLKITGFGLSLSEQNPSKCVIYATLTIDPNTPAGSYSLLIVDQTTGAPVDSTDISVLDNAAGPIPPGLEPEVDVIWGVMSQNDCSDAFGKRIAHSLYCIQLKIGNNSGHPIQIAGVGFTKSLRALEALGIKEVTVANTSYGSTRAVLVQSQETSGRNLVFNGLAGAGLIMAASSPFFFGSGPSAQRAKTRFLTVSTIVNGPLQQAFNLLFPDPILNQLKSLDDQSFRDNMIIPNNAQVQTVAFVEKQNVTTALRELEIQLSAAAAGAQKTAEASQNDADAAEQKASTLQGDATKAAKAKEEAGMKRADQQHSVMTAKILDEMSARASKTIRNSERPGTRKGSFNPLLVKLALGNVVIVGDEIQYLHRVQIQSSAAASSAVAVAVNPAAPQVPAGAVQQFTATVTNDQNGAGVNWDVSGPNCKADTCGTFSNKTTAAVTYTAPKSVPAPNDTVTVTATSIADGTKSGTATVKILPAIKVAFNLGFPPTLTHGTAGVPFSVNVTNDPANAGVIWSIPGGAGCTGSNCTALSAITPTSVTYTPPAAVPNPNTVTLTATSKTDPSQTAQLTITIN